MSGYMVAINNGNDYSNLLMVNNAIRSRHASRLINGRAWTLPRCSLRSALRRSPISKSWQASRGSSRPSMRPAGRLAATTSLMMVVDRRQHAHSDPMLMEAASERKGWRFTDGQSQSICLPASAAGVRRQIALNSVQAVLRRVYRDDEGQRDPHERYA